MLRSIRSVKNIGFGFSDTFRKCGGNVKLPDVCLSVCVDDVSRAASPSVISAMTVWTYHASLDRQTDGSRERMLSERCAAVELQSSAVVSVCAQLLQRQETDIARGPHHPSVLCQSPVAVSCR